MLTFFATVFALGTLWFWLLLLIDFVVITALVENEQGFWATVTAIASIIGLNYLWKLPILTTIKASPWTAAGFIGLYFLIGAGWLTFKWWTFLHKETRKYEDFKAEFLASNSSKELTPELAFDLQAALVEKNRYSQKDRPVIHPVPPSARKYKADLVRWGTYWPFSMVGFALNDVVRKTWNYIYDLLQSTLQRISDHMFSWLTFGHLTKSYFRNSCL